MGLCGIYVRTSVETDGTSIEQQKELGIKFCETQSFRLQVYEDIGKSGYKIDDENDPFKNRQGLTKLIADVEKGAVDKIWVYEHSRLSRNQYAWFVLRRIFEKNKVEIYENGKLFKTDDPQSQMIQGILTQISQYERHLITSRTTRGLRATINTGLRTYNKIYGYKNMGKQANGYIGWEPVRSEIENIKYSFQKYLAGNSVDSIIKDLNEELPEDKRVLFHKNYINVLKRFDYTGFSLTTEGSELYRKYKNFEIENLDFLKERENGKPKYYLPSVNYSVQIVSLEDWVAAAKRLRDNKLIYKNMKRRTNTEIFTGLMNCPYCNLNYYFHNDDSKNYGYQYYTHTPSKKCLQRPKSVRREKINSLIEVFYFYFFLVFDDTKKLLEESQAITNLNLAKIKDRISAAQGENRKIEKQINNFQSLYEESTDRDFLKLTLIKESELKLKLEGNNEVIVKLKSELVRLKDEYNRDKMELTYYNVKEKIIDFVERLSVEDKRAELIKIIKRCQLFGNYLLIDTGKLLFVFNVKEVRVLPSEIYGEFKDDVNFKDNFLSSGTPGNEKYKHQSDIQEPPDIPKELLERLRQNETRMRALDAENKLLGRHIVRRMGELKIREYDLAKPENKVLMGSQLSQLGIKYDLTDISKVIDFTEDV